MGGGANIQRTWSDSRENMNPKNNKRVLFNFFKPRLPIKAEQTYPAFFFLRAAAVQRISQEKKKKMLALKRKRVRGGEQRGAHETNENSTFTQIG